MESVMASNVRCRFSELYIDHLAHPRLLVSGDGPEFRSNGEAEIAGQVSGTFMKLWLEVNNEARIIRVGWRVLGMPEVVATTSVMAEWLMGDQNRGMGMTLEAAQHVTPEQVADLAGGLPGRKIHETVVGPRVLGAAIGDHFFRLGFGDGDYAVARRAEAPLSPPCECLGGLARILRETPEKGAGSDASTLFGNMERETMCPSCRGYIPAIRLWLKKRRRRLEGQL